MCASTAPLRITITDHSDAAANVSRLSIHAYDGVDTENLARADPRLNWHLAPRGSRTECILALSLPREFVGPLRYAGLIWDDHWMDGREGGRLAAKRNSKVARAF